MGRERRPPIHSSGYAEYSNTRLATSEYSDGPALRLSLSSEGRVDLVARQTACWLAIACYFAIPASRRRLMNAQPDSPASAAAAAAAAERRAITLLNSAHWRCNS